ncbi:MAG: AbrB family transcriptional regulator [Chamaesiphon sp. CSU_1_12]|nr:AbrB family transcriptional regulator [Chamaesiphon sp. CSU_1_12]
MFQSQSDELNTQFEDESLEKSADITSEIFPLVGKPLLAKIAKFSHFNKREKARLCGYVREVNGTVRVNLGGFYDAVLAAKGLALETNLKSGRNPTFQAVVQKNGQILIGSTYTRQMGLSEGDSFEIKLGYKHIYLVMNDDSDRLEAA